MNDKIIGIIGLGGLGGHVLAQASRLKPKKIILFDGDKFDESNIDRQLFATKNSIGKFKAEISAKIIESVTNSIIEFHNEFLDETNISILNECDLVFDCVDNVNTKLLLSSYCLKHNKVLVHGAISETCGQVLLCLPKDDLLKKIYKNKEELHTKNISFGVALVASIEVNVAYKYFENDYEDLIDKLILIDLSDISIKKIKI